MLICGPCAGYGAVRPVCRAPSGDLIGFVVALSTFRPVELIIVETRDRDLENQSSTGNSHEHRDT
ncbi:hypothetical protein HOE425_331589 [Hoeflea sp. EC-HK425]|nr:hypothetical protein HOE425_331589 [Hoeflea sp. EC-HK425]